MAARAGNIRSCLLNLLSHIRLAIGSLFIWLLRLLRSLGGLPGAVGHLLCLLGGGFSLGGGGLGRFLFAFIRGRLGSLGGLLGSLV